MLSWFLLNRRSFPWRENPTPYRVWISEVMLQQTRAQVVVSYFERWMQQFPDIKTLASSSSDQVIKAWEGLGYYSRARNLHLGAKYLLTQHGGDLPNSFEELLKVPGVGRYTAAAILSFGFKLRAAPVDGNVARVISRYAWIDQPVDKAAGKRLIEEKADLLLDSQRPWISAEALIELGATVCTPRKPRCEDCPLSASCIAREKNAPEALPILSPRPVTIELKRGIALIECDGFFLVKKNLSGQVMADLYEFPIFEKATTIHKMQEELALFYGDGVRFISKWKMVSHSFTRYRAHLYPFYFKGEKKHKIEGYQWVCRSSLKSLPFSSGHRKLLINL